MRVNGTVQQSRSYDAANQVTGWSYDAAGNLTNDGTQSSTYDALNRLTGVTKGGTKTTYTLNGDGTLVATSLGHTTSYVPDLAT